MTDDRAAEGLEHLQGAALEMIKAARAFLDVVEEVVVDRDKVAEVIGAMGTVADMAVRAARGAMPDGAPPGPDPGGEERASSVHHIRVS